MTPRITLVVFVAALLLGIGAVMTGTPEAYTLNGPKWNRTPISYYINPTNLDLPEAAVVTAVRAGADTWAQQSNVNFSFSYGGPSSVTTNTLDNVNVVMFRNASSGQAIATTYYWSNSSGLLDADIVFWDEAFQFFSGSTGCSGGFYIEDIAAHEFGHALGLGHSTSTAATMYPSVSWCNTSNRVLDADDIAGAIALYGTRAGGLPLAPTGLRITGQ
jgi:hypothetical protein